MADTDTQTTVFETTHLASSNFKGISGPEAARQLFESY